MKLHTLTPLTHKHALPLFQCAAPSLSLSLYFYYSGRYPCRLWLRKIYEFSRTQQRVCVNVCVRKQPNFKADSIRCELQKWEDELRVGGRWESEMCPSATFPQNSLL